MPDAKQNSVYVLDRARSGTKDRRAEHTRKRLDAAFIELLHRKAYGNIRVSDIARRARIGRATFYAYYLSKDELLRSQFSRMVAPLIRDGEKPYRIDAGAFFHHIKSAPRLYGSLVASVEAGSAPAILRKCLETRILEILSRAGPDLLDQQIWSVVQVRFVAASLFVVVEYWLNSGSDESAEQVHNLFARLIWGGLPGLPPANLGTCPLIS